MKKSILAIITLLATQALQAQVLYVNNNDNTYQAFDTNEVGLITFNEELQLISIELENGSVVSRFNTGQITNIATAPNQGDELTYDPAPTVAFDASDKENFNEEIQSIPTDELDEEYDDFIENYATSRSVNITFSETGVTTGTLPSGVTAEINGSHIVINSTIGKIGYILKGNCSNGSLKIYSAKKFQLIVNGLNLTNPNGPAINIQSGKTVYFTIADGKTNTLCDGALYNAPVTGTDGIEEDQKGTIFSEGQIIFDGYKNGTGTLNVKSLGNHAIASDDYIVVRGGNINITEAAKDGFHTKERFTMGRTTAYTPTVTVNATSNGIDCREGFVKIDAGKLEITSGSEAIKVVYEDSIPNPIVIPDAYINGGYIKLTTTDEKSSAIKTTRNYTQAGGIIHAEVKGNGSKIINCDGEVAITNGRITGFSNGTLSADTTSAGGIKSVGALNITGGKVAIECKGKGAKGINCDSNAVISGGEVTLLATAENYTGLADDKKSRAITAQSITVNGGTVVASAYDHAISSLTDITINGGSINAYSTSSTALDTEATQTGGWLLTKDAE